MPILFEDPAQLEFRRRPENRPRRMRSFSPQSAWLVIAIIASLLFVLFVRAMLERSAWTARHSKDVPITSPGDVRTDAELSAQPWSGVPEPDEEASQAPVMSSMPTRTAAVYRCVGTGGAVAFQSMPCEGTQRTTRPEPARRPQRQESQAVNQYSYVASRSTDMRDQQRARCNVAKQQRDQTLERVGLARTYDLLRRLDEMVYEACKGL
jgi:hypothetical protein